MHIWIIGQFSNENIVQYLVVAIVGQDLGVSDVVGTSTLGVSLTSRGSNGLPGRVICIGWFWRVWVGPWRVRSFINHLSLGGSHFVFTVYSLLSLGLWIINLSIIRCWIVWGFISDWTWDNPAGTRSWIILLPKTILVTITITRVPHA